MPSLARISSRTVAGEPIVDGGVPLGHFGSQLMLSLAGERGLVKGIVIPAIVRGQRFLQ